MPGSSLQNLDALLDEFMVQGMREKRITGRRKKREADIRKLYMEYTDPNRTLPPVSEEMAGERRREAAAGLLAKGIQVPKERAKVDWTPMFDAMHFPEDHWLRVLAPELSDEQVRMLAFRIKPDFGRTEAELKAVMPLFEGTPLEGKQDLVRAAMQAGDFLTKEATTGLLGLKAPEVQPLDVLNSVIFDDQGAIRSFDSFTTAEKLLLSDAGFSDKELKAAYDIADDDVGADEILRLKRGFLKDWSNWMGLRASRAPDNQSLEAITAEVERYVPILADFLQENKLTPEMQEVFDMINTEGLKAKYSKDEVRKMLKEANLPGIDDNAIEIILQKAYKYGK